MERLSKKEIKARIEALKQPPTEGTAPGDATNGPQKLSAKKSSQRIRKQGV